MKKYLILQIIILSIITNITAQTIPQIKSSNQYLWGEGKARRLRRADNLALKDLTSQISVQVESKFTDIVTEKEGNVKDFTKSMITTYSSTTLQHAQRLVKESPDQTIVLRYIKQEDVANIFNNRKDKIIDYTRSGIRAEKEYRIADALKYYYWALLLLKSHPDHNTIKAEFPKNGKRLLLSALPDRINRIFTFLDISVNNIIKKQNKSIIKLDINYKNHPVQNLDYIYWTGNSWTNFYSCRDGLGIAEFYGDQINQLDNLRLKVEYVFENKAKVDQELQQVIDNMKNIPYFREADYNISLQKQESQQAQNPQYTATNMAESEAKVETKSVTDVVMDVVEAISTDSYASVKDNFTPQGYQMFDKIIEYGQAEIIDQSKELQTAKLDSNIIVRSLTMKFSFPNNDRTFIEDVVFTMNDEHKIKAVSFALSDKAIQDVMSKSDQFGSLTEKQCLIRFMENYKTAYCLERLDYIESIFSENALIVGSVVKEGQNIEGMYNQLGRKRVKYIRLSKKQYIERLSHIFNGNEYVNLHFEDNQVKKVSNNKKIYGIQIKQNYYSTNYADKGYLFLMFDLSDTTQPKIYVRTWQPKKHQDGSVYGLDDFHF